MGLSNSQVRALLAIVLGAAASPGRSTIHRWVQAAGKAAGRVLEQLDQSCSAFVLVGCLDEIFFHRRPVLVGVEPKSMVWFLGRKCDDRQASTWFSQLKPWTSLSYVVSDAGSGLRAGLALMQHHQRADGQLPLQKGLGRLSHKKGSPSALKHHVAGRRTGLGRSRGSQSIRRKATTARHQRSG
jgi:hypothetical protein